MPANPSGSDKSNRNNRVVVKELMIGPSSIQIFSGTAATRAAARTLAGDSAPIGSIVIGAGAVGTTKPNLYVRVALGPADTDFERIVTQASD